MQYGCLRATTVQYEWLKATTVQYEVLRVNRYHNKEKHKLLAVLVRVLVGENLHVLGMGRKGGWSECFGQLIVRLNPVWLNKSIITL